MTKQAEREARKAGRQLSDLPIALIGKPAVDACTAIVQSAIDSETATLRAENARLRERVEELESKLKGQA